MKPFNIEHAEAGAPITPGVKVYDWEFKLSNGATCIMGAYEGHVRYWTRALGAHMRPDPNTRGLAAAPQLYMVPIGTLGGREVYYGDKLLLKGCEFTVVNGDVLDVTAQAPHQFDPREWSWPQQYPVTRMTVHEASAVCQGVPGVDISLIAVANAAIRHGIDNGYLLDPEGDPDTGVKRGRILAEIAKDIGCDDGYAYASIPAAVRLHIVAVAKHFYQLGYISGRRCGIAGPMNHWFISELTKVKS